MPESEAVCPARDGNTPDSVALRLVPVTAIPATCNGEPTV